MLLNCYYYAPHNHTLLDEYVNRDLERMVSLGVDVVSFCVQESQISNWHQQRVRNVVNLAHAHGLKVHAAPNRWAGLTAGWLDGFSRFTVRNPDTLIQDRSGAPVRQGEMVSCVNHPKTRDHICASLDALFEAFEFDGLIWDEPHSRACYCPRCCALCSGEPDAAWYHARFAAFLDEMSARVKALCPGAIVSLFAQPQQGDMLKAMLFAEHLDYFGSDGHVRSSDHQMRRMKGTIFEAHEQFYPLIRAVGKKTFFLLEAQRHRDEDLDNYLANLDRALALPMDQMMFYYSAHEMSPEKALVFNDKTWQAIARLRG